MDQLNTTLGARSQTFIDMKDTIKAGMNDGTFKNDQDVSNFIIDTGYNPEDYLEANKEYNRLIAKGENPRDVSIPELLFKTTTKFVSDTAEALSNKVPITKNIGNLIGDGTKDWWSNYSDPYTPPGAKEITKEIGADIGQGALGIYGVAKGAPIIGKFIPGKGKIDTKKIKKLNKAVKNVSKLRTALKKGAKTTAKNTVIGATGITLAFNPDEATLDVLKQNFPETIEWAKLDPIVDALAVDPEDPIALQYLNQFGQELFAAGVVATPILGISLLNKAIRNSKLFNAKTDGVDSPITVTKNKGEDTLANNADQEKVLINEVVEVDNVDGGSSLLKKIRMSKPISYFKENFLANRNIGDDAYDLWITKKGTPKVVRQQTVLDLKDFNKAIKKDYGASKFNKLKKNIQDKINNVLLLDKDNPAYINLFNKNLDIVKPIIKKQLDAENAQRISQGKKKIPIKNYNKKLKDMSRAEALKQTDNFYRIQRNKLLKTLKPDTRKIVIRLRNNVDDHSNYLINSGVLDSKLSSTFSSNNSFYLQRSYDIFDDPSVSRNLNRAFNELTNEGKGNLNFLIKNPKYQTEIDKIQKFHSYLKNTLGLNEDEITNIIKKNISKKGAQETFEFFEFANKNFGNPNVLKHRKIFSKELRDMWGEKKNPLTRYSQTMDSLGKISAQVKFLKDLRADGLNKGYLHLSSKIKPSKKVKDVDDLNTIEYKLDATDKVHLGRLDREGGLQLPAAFKSPLEGIFADVDWARGLRRGLSNEELVGGTMPFKIYRAISSGLKGTAEVAKTILSPVTQGVNFVGNFNFATLLGGANPIEFFKTFGRSASPSFFKGQKWNDWFNKRTKLGIIDESINAKQMQAYMNDISEVVKGSKTTSAIINGLLYPIRLPTKIYQGADSIMRATVFDSLRSSIRRNIEPTLKDMPIINNRTLEDVLDHFIAERVRMRMPTWSMVPKGIRGLKDVPFFGSFPSWFEEVLRTTNRSLRGIGNDLSGRSVNDLARQAGFKNADDMLQKTGYNLRKNKKVMGYLRGKGMWSLGAGTGLALGYDALTDTSRLTYNISEKQSDTLNELVDYYQATPKVFTNNPERVKKYDKRKGAVTNHLIYSYKEPSRVDVWQGIKNPIRRMIRTIKNNEELTDAQIKSQTIQATYEFLSPIVGPSIAAKALIDIATNNIGNLPEGSGEKELATWLNSILGPNAGFTPGAIAEYQRLSQANITEETMKNFGTTENVWEWNGQSWINKGGRTPEGINPKTGMPLASKYEAGKFWENILDGEFYKINKDNVLANFGMKTKQVDINQLVKFKVTPLWYQKSLIKGDFIKDVIKMRDVGVDENQLLTYWRDTLEKHYQADRTLSKLVSKFKILGLSDSDIAVAVSETAGKDLKLKTNQIEKLLINKYDNTQLLPTSKENKRMLQVLKEAGITLDNNTYVINEMNKIWNEYTNKPF